MANFDLIEYQKRVIADLTAENKALKAELQAVKNTRIKIQYHNEELTIKEICERLDDFQNKVNKYECEIAVKSTGTVNREAWGLIISLKQKRKRVKTMAEYIERQKVIDITAETGALETQRRVQEIPAADVAEMVRCKDCKFCDDAYCNDGRKLKDLYYCNWFGSVVEKNDFCSYGAKMDLEESK